MKPTVFALLLIAAATIAGAQQTAIVTDLQVKDLGTTRTRFRATGGELHAVNAAGTTTSIWRSTNAEFGRRDVSIYLSGMQPELEILTSIYIPGAGTRTVKSATVRSTNLAALASTDIDGETQFGITTNAFPDIGEPSEGFFTATLYRADATITSASRSFTEPNWEFTGGQWLSVYAVRAAEHADITIELGIE